MAHETKTTIEDGTYFLHPEGSCWIAAQFRNGRAIGYAEESNASTHAAAGDSWGGVVPSDTDVDVEPYEADMIVSAVMGEDTDPTMVVVQRAGDA